MRSFSMSSHALARTNLAIRALQFVLSVATLVAIGRSFNTHVDNDYHVRYGSHEIQFLLVMAYSGLMLSMWHVVCVERLQYAPRPSKITVRGVDGALSIMLLCGSIAMAMSSYVWGCDMYLPRVNCRTITATTVFGFFTSLAFAASCAMTFVPLPSSEAEAPSMDYISKATPHNGSNRLATAV
ncbi:hypothetical protein PINS_up010615 [Pythium insidiosum]|nr:hypothetical protein PINS_up010615 [Pythium insidiosum]